MQVKQILSSGSEELPFEVTSQKVAGHLFSSVPVGCVLWACLPEVDLPELQGSSAKETGQKLMECCFVPSFRRSKMLQHVLNLRV